MKVNDKILSLPPYISTSWKNVSSLQVENQHGAWVLSIELISGKRVIVPNLDGATIEQIFACHAAHVEEQEAALKKPFTFTFPLPMNMPGMEGFTGMLQHNPEQADSPLIPPELLDKVAQIVKSLGVEDGSTLPKAEPHCNCPHCQIMRVMSGEPPAVAAIEEAVSDEDLKFRTWDIVQTADKLFTVTNPLDTKEHYNVFLGEPLGCTCGQKNCEHIQAVLRS